MDGRKKVTFDLSGKVAVVVGGARGIGRGIALSLATAGADVAIADINIENALLVKKEVSELGKKSDAIGVDVTVKQSCEDMVHKIVNEFGKLDIAINSAGIPGSRFGSSEDIDEQSAKKIFGIMLIGYFFCCQAESRPMIKQNFGRIINIASVSGVIVNKGLQGLAPYCAAKAGVIHMSRAFASDWAKHNITVNSISPGYVRTPATDSVLNIPERYKMYIDTVPLNRIATPDDIAGAAVFLASDEAAYITGINLLVDGGITIW